jgi:hypothetical protein
MSRWRLREEGGYGTMLRFGGTLGANRFWLRILQLLIYGFGSSVRGSALVNPRLFEAIGAPIKRCTRCKIRFQNSGDLQKCGKPNFGV